MCKSFSVLSVFLFKAVTCSIGFLPTFLLSETIEEIDLSHYEKRIFSQNGEDGVTRKIFDVIGTTNKYFVEFGVEDGRECNTRDLRQRFHWTGLMMDGNHQNKRLNLRKEFITAENISKLFKKYNVPYEFDLLSIDIDFNDFYVWHALKDYHPRVVIIEYNSTPLPTEDKVIVYNPRQMWDGTNYFGASILALTKLGLMKGYSLVYANANGVNLFFIRNDVLNDISNRARFLNCGDPQKIYKKPTYGGGPNGGHGADPQQRPYLTFAEAHNIAEHLIPES